MSMTYKEQLNSPHWQRRRLEMLEAADFACSVCGDTESTLHVHHKRYIKGRSVWEYSDKELSVLCADCHETLHIEKERLDQLVSTILPNRIDDVYWILRGLISLPKVYEDTDKPMFYLAGKLANYSSHCFQESDIRYFIDNELQLPTKKRRKTSAKK